VRQRWDGQPSAIEVFQARTQAWRAAFPHAPRPRSWIADATRSHADHAIPLRHLGVLTRRPHTMGSVAAAITPARAWERGPRRDDHTRDPRRALCPEGMAPRGLVVSSQAARARAKATRTHARHRADEASHRPLVHRHAPRVATPAAAHEARTAGAKGWTEHQVASDHLSAPTRDARPGRPTPRRPGKAIDWPIQAHVRPAEAVLGSHKPRQAGWVIGTTIGASAWRATAVIAADTRPSRVAGGCRCLNDPRLVVSALVVKTPCRLHGLLRVMTRAVLGSSVAPRRWRRP
jgi:hypothetical protein